MKIFNYSMTINYDEVVSADPEQLAGWKAKLENGKVVSFITNSKGKFTKELFVATTEKANTSITDNNIDNIELLPLYGKALIDVKNEKDKRSSSLIYFETKEGVDIRGIKLLGCASIVHRINADRTACALTLYNLRPNSKVLFILSNGEVRIIENGEKVITDKCKGEVPEAKQIVVKRLIFLPKNTFFTRYSKEGEKKGPVNFKEGFISVSIAQALSKYSEVIGNPTNIEYDPALTEKDLNDLSKMLTSRGIIKSECKNCDKENCSCDTDGDVLGEDIDTSKFRNRDKRNFKQSNNRKNSNRRPSFDGEGRDKRKPFNKKNNRNRK